jgi:RNA polymerase sigma factor (sigma-70 family)
MEWMNREMPTLSDSSLLQAWCDERSQSAFSELVRRYERLVAGAALRRSGDLELARDVTQQVFTMLAAKARLLVGRSNIAGWLYRAASHFAAQLRRSDARRLVRDRCAEVEHRSDPREDHWSILEEALKQLGAAEREALLMHYFQDLSYPEMAAQLGIGEAAARKRVSRGLQNLGPALRKHGLGCPKTLLAGAAALQVGVPANAALAAGAMAGSSTVSTPLTLIFHALMSHLPIKIAVCAASLALLPLGYQWAANATLHAQLAQERSTSVSAASRPAEHFPPNPSGLAELRTELERVQLAAKTAEARVAELSFFKDRARDELVVSLGTVESMAKRFGTTLRRMREMNEGNKNPAPGSADAQAQDAAMKELQAGLAQVFTALRELPRLERNPAKAARFYATMLGETAELNDGTRARLEPVLNAWIQQLQQDSLALSQRPREPKEVVVEWDERRIAAMHKISGELQTLLPEEKAERLSLFEAMLIQPEMPGASGAFDIMSGRNR